ncbi:MAG TPA: hypothetical protein DCZ94_13885 [Lentisphaeria bacterium]|nr:hypothetical protein [Lentisphaeria bacterium]
MNNLDGVILNIYQETSYNGKSVSNFVEEESIFIECDFTSANIHGAVITDAIFIACNFSKANLGLCTAFRTKFISCEFDSTLFKGSNLESSVFINCNIKNCDFTSEASGGKGIFNDITTEGCTVEGTFPEE